jgi:hypothetical protein
MDRRARGLLQARWEDTAMQWKMAAYAVAVGIILALGVRVPQASGAFSVRAYIIPDPVFYDAYPTLYARSVMGADCTASVVYSTGDAPQSFDGSARTIGRSGLAGWTWHVQSSGTGGRATVTCSFHGQTRSVTTSFSIA